MNFNRSANFWFSEYRRIAQSRVNNPHFLLTSRERNFDTSLSRMYVNRKLIDYYFYWGCDARKLKRETNGSRKIRSTDLDLYGMTHFLERVSIG
jgi:hypothetical protein